MLGYENLQNIWHIDCCVRNAPSNEAFDSPKNPYISRHQWFGRNNYPDSTCATKRIVTVYSLMAPSGLQEKTPWSPLEKSGLNEKMFFLPSNAGLRPNVWGLLDCTASTISNMRRFALISGLMSEMIKFWRSGKKDGADNQRVRDLLTNCRELEISVKEKRWKEDEPSYWYTILPIRSNEISKRLTNAVTARLWGPGLTVPTGAPLRPPLVKDIVCGKLERNCPADRRAVFGLIISTVKVSWPSSAGELLILCM